MKAFQVALYARVSSEQQAKAKTIESLLAEIRVQIQADGFPLNENLEFVDDGYSGTTLIRPALEHLRDLAAAGEIDRLYVHCPDRLARNYAYKVLLLEELTCAGVSVVFLNRPVGQTPEDQLLLQVQGVVAEYCAGEAVGTESPRETARRTSRTGKHPLPCSLWISLYQPGEGSGEGAV